MTEASRLMHTRKVTALGGQVQLIEYVDYAHQKKYISKWRATWAGRGSRGILMTKALTF